MESTFAVRYSCSSSRESVPLRFLYESLVHNPDDNDSGSFEGAVHDSRAPPHDEANIERSPLRP